MIIHRNEIAIHLFIRCCIIQIYSFYSWEQTNERPKKKMLINELWILVFLNWIEMREEKCKKFILNIERGKKNYCCCCCWKTINFIICCFISIWWFFDFTIYVSSILFYFFFHRTTTIASFQFDDVFSFHFLFSVN